MSEPEPITVKPMAKVFAAYADLERQLEEAQGKLATLTDATMQHLGGERLDRTCACPLGDILDGLPASAWTVWEQTQRARILRGSKEGE